MRTRIALLVIDDTDRPLYEIPVDSHASQSVMVADDFTWLVTFDRAQTLRVRFFKLE